MSNLAERAAESEWRAYCDAVRARDVNPSYANCAACAAAWARFQTAFQAVEMAASTGGANVVQFRRMP